MSTPTTPAAAAAEGYVELDRRKGPLPSTIKNKEKRSKLLAEQRTQRAKDKRETRRKRKREAEEGGEQVAKRPVQQTLDTKREADETVVMPDDEEVAADQGTDELSSYFNGTMPKIIVTTSRDAIGESIKFAECLINIFPTAEYFPRKQFEMKKILAEVTAKGYTDLVIVNEDRRVPTGLLITHLPDGPTAHFKLSSVTYEDGIANHGRSQGFYPEVILNNFHTRLGHQVGRLLSAMFPQAPEFQGREVVTLHNQRDFIFFRHHRYIFRHKEKVGLQELGPRFTLKLRSLQKGPFDSKLGEYEWVHKRKEMNTSRTRFFL